MENFFHSASLAETPVQKSGHEPKLAKHKTQIVIELIEYIPHVVVSKTVIKKNTNNVQNPSPKRPKITTTIAP